MDIHIKLSSVSKTHKLYQNPTDRLKEILTKKKYHSTINALNNINIEIKKSECVALIGRNGAGKSTALQLITGVLQPSSGQIEVKGRLAALLELGSGFNPEFSGIDNIFLNASILGLSNEETKMRLNDILNFADIGEFVNYPVKTYSSGMLLRLAFAVAVSVDPDILIIDEALAVGDESFQHKCIAKMTEIKANGTSLLFVSHDISTVKALCDRAILLDHGEVILDSTPEKAAKRYHQLCYEADLLKYGANNSTTEELSENSERLGTNEVTIKSVQTLSSEDENSKNFLVGEKIKIELLLEVHKQVEHAVVGVIIKDKRGQDMITTNSDLEKIAISNLKPGQTIKVSFTFTNYLKDDHYSITTAITKKDNVDNYCYLDWVNDAIIFNSIRKAGKEIQSLTYPNDLEVEVVNVSS